MLNLFSKNKKKAQQGISKEVMQRVEELEGKLRSVADELAHVQEEMKKAIERVGIIRFNPFGEIGSDQSFSVALLNSEYTGVVLTSHYGKDANRIYAKPVKRGTSDYSLSNEEKEAIQRAMRS